VRCCQLATRCTIVAANITRQQIGQCDGIVRVAAYAFRHDGVLCHLHTHKRAFPLLQTSYIEEEAVTHDITKTKREREGQWPVKRSHRWSITVNNRYSQETDFFVNRREKELLKCLVKSTKQKKFEKSLQLSVIIEIGSFVSILVWDISKDIQSWHNY
jgi:hypothetical protein